MLPNVKTSEKRWRGFRPTDDLPQADAVARRCGRTPCTQWHLALLCIRARLTLAAYGRRGRLLLRPPPAHEPCTHVPSRSQAPWLVALSRSVHQRPIILYTEDLHIQASTKESGKARGLSLATPACLRTGRFPTSRMLTRPWRGTALPACGTSGERAPGGLPADSGPTAGARAHATAHNATACLVKYTKSQEETR